MLGGYGMKVRCKEVGNSEHLKLGEVYESLQEIGKFYLIKMNALGGTLYPKELFEPVKEEGFNAQNTTINIAGINFVCKGTPCMFATKNWNVKEDKMEDVRIVRKLEELDGLENGIGLVMAFDTEKVIADIEIKTLSILRVFNSEILYKVDVEIKSSLEYILEIAKSMGFKFKYKPLRTVEEVIAEMIAKTDNIFKEDRNYDLYEVEFIKFTKHYKIRLAETVGAPVFVAGLAQKYADELNEILKNK
ncbi:MAG: hypothetical protein ACRC3Z_06725 [Phocaeicola sp.]